MAFCVKEMPSPAQLSPISFLSTLHKCRTEKDLALALRLQDACILERQFLVEHPSLGEQLISVLVAFGNMTHARQVFDMLSIRKQCSWDALIIGYMKHGESHHAISIYKKMQEDPHIRPSRISYALLVKACGTLQELETGAKLHESIAKTGLLDRDIFVGSALVEMYIKLGFLERAQDVFDKLPVVDVVLWTLLIAGYVEHGFGQRAVCCYERMRKSNVAPDALTFACALRACGCVGAMSKGMEVHIDIVKKCLEEQLLVSNALVDMYAKCGLLETALQVLDKLPAKDVVCWNALIAGYTKHGHGEKALRIFDQMQCEGIPSDCVTFVHSLKACCKTENDVKGRDIHTEIVQKGFETQIFVSSTLVNMYAKGGLLADAQAVFDTVASPNQVLCNALLAGYLEHKSGVEALRFFESMQHEGKAVSAITFVLGLKSCSSAGAISKAQEMHAEIVRKGLEGDLLVCGTVVDLYGKCGALAEAQSVFDSFPCQDVVSWTALLAGYSEHGHDEEVFDYFEQMQQECIPLNAITCVCILKACGNIGSTVRGLRLHADILKKGLDSELLVGNALVEMYAKCKWLVTAQSLFDRLLIHDPSAYNALVSGYLEQGAGDKILMCLEWMRLRTMLANAITLVSCLKACGNTGSTSYGQWLHLEIVKRGLDEELLIGNTLIDTYAKCGLLREAYILFEDLPARSVVSWTSLMSGYAQVGKCGMVFKLLDSMMQDGIMPNWVTCVCILNACSHAGLVSEGCSFFEVMSCELGFIPTMEHYTCIIDMLGRIGHIDKALTILWKMPMQPDIISWQNVLGACQKRGDVELGKHAFDHAVRIDERDAAAYVYMHNIYADASRQRRKA